MVSGHYEIIVDEFLITLLKMPGLTIYPYFFSSIPNKSKGFDYCHDSSAPGGGAAAVLGGGTFEEEIGEAFRGGGELSSTNESCEICSDDPPNMGIQCDDESTITRKCNKSNRWRTEKFCKSSCYDIGLGYDNIVCC